MADATPAWIWTPELPGTGATLALDDEAAHHVVRVCRVRVGDTLTLTDGHGGVARATRLESGRVATVRIGARRTLAPGPARVLLIGVPEGERADWLIEKAVELGITALCPVDLERARWERFARHHARWQRLARAALGQSLRAWLPRLAEPLPLAEALAAVPDGAACWVADPGGTPAATAGCDPHAAQVGAIGPAAGFADSERDSLATRGFRPICLSEGRLRAETAAIAVASWWASHSQPATLDAF